MESNEHLVMLRIDIDEINKIFNEIDEARRTVNQAVSVDRHIIICQFQKIKLCKSDTGIFHPRAPGILAVTVIEKIITVTTRLKTKYFNLTKSANYSIK